MRIIALSLIVLTCTSNVVNGFFGGKKEKEEQKIGAKESVALGIDMMMQAASDPASLKEAMSMLNDPATRKEVESMMADPAFKKEMEKMKNNPVYMNAVQGAKEVLEPQRGAGNRGRAASPEVEDLSDADLGMQQMMKAAKDPKMIAEAMEMMKDPETAAQVKAMMNDPKFQAQMKQYTSDPAYQKAFTKASDDMETLSKDPARLKKLEQDFAQKMRK